MDARIVDQTLHARLERCWADSTYPAHIGFLHEDADIYLPPSLSRFGQFHSYRTEGGIAQHDRVRAVRTLAHD